MSRSYHSFLEHNMIKKTASVIVVEIAYRKTFDKSLFSRDLGWTKLCETHLVAVHSESLGDIGKTGNALSMEISIVSVDHPQILDNWLIVGTVKHDVLSSRETFRTCSSDDLSNVFLELGGEKDGGNSLLGKVD